MTEENKPFSFAAPLTTPTPEPTSGTGLHT